MISIEYTFLQTSTINNVEFIQKYKLTCKMSNFQASCSKTLVRNTKQRIPQTNVNKGGPSYPENRKTLPERKKTVKGNHVNNDVDLGLPMINTSKTVVKKIKEVESLKKVRSKSDGDVSGGIKITMQEKLTKQMNFPYDQQIYKDLIPLCVKPTVQLPPSRPPLLQKDIEPNLQDFVKRKTFPEYTFEVNTISKTRKPIREHDGFKIHKLTQRW